MTDIASILSREFSRPVPIIEAVLSIFSEGGTVPFVARYRKEVTRNMDETGLRALEERWNYLKELEDRKKTVLSTIEEQGKLTGELEKKIITCLDKADLEELYLPYKPKRKTRAVAAREKGLEPLSEAILNDSGSGNPEELAKGLFDHFKDVKTVEEALKGASDIIAERVSENTELRAMVRTVMEKEGAFASSVHPDYKDKVTKFEMYYSFSAPVSSISSHNLLGMCRGEKEGVLVLSLDADDAAILGRINSRVVKNPASACGRFVSSAVEEGYKRLMRGSVVASIRAQNREKADEEAIKNFADNLYKLLLFPPAGTRPVLAIDPGFRTGCKVAVLDRAGDYKEYSPIFPTEPRNDKLGAARVLTQYIKKYAVELIAIGNGTASRETESFVREYLRSPAAPEGASKITVVMVNESGASVYSASETAVEEFPDLDVTVRGAISIGRRLQDPLAELVKIEPRSLGVGQYQHDVNPILLKRRLENVVESCVNRVGVDLNTASPHLLSHVAGINSRTAAAITRHRREKGLFRSRRDLMKVAGIGEKAFEQSAGFLRIREADNPLDNSSVHPERYGIVSKMAQKIGVDLKTLVGNETLAKSIPKEDFLDATAGVGLPTITDIVEELARPGRDPRAVFRTAEFKEGVAQVKDLSAGMVLEGNVTNVANFGAFVDIGVHQDGLVHISELANRYVKDPHEVVNVGDVVKVKVLTVDTARNRIELSMKALKAQSVF